MIDFLTRVRSGFYKNTLPYPEKPQRPILKSNHTAAEARTYANLLSSYEQSLESLHTARKNYDAQTSCLQRRFHDDLLDYLGIVGHPRAEKLWELAYSRGHDSGYENVVAEAEELVELLS